MLQDCTSRVKNEGYIAGMLLLIWKEVTVVGSHNGAAIPRSAMHVFISRLILRAFSTVSEQAVKLELQARSINEALHDHTVVGRRGYPLQEHVLKKAASCSRTMQDA